MQATLDQTISFIRLHRSGQEIMPSFLITRSTQDITNAIGSGFVKKYSNMHQCFNHIFVLAPAHIQPVLYNICNIPTYTMNQSWIVIGRFRIVTAIDRESGVIVFKFVSILFSSQLLPYQSKCKLNNRVDDTFVFAGNSAATRNIVCVILKQISFQMHI